jgi:UDP-N-acetylmuramyl pentapeptide phosphotransferase/UDP-N-acetylglucosamine-1-phosphate transferase
MHDLFVRSAANKRRRLFVYRRPPKQSAALRMEILSLSYAFLIVFTASAGVCMVILLSRRIHMPLAERRLDTGAIQAAHSHPTPRIGGLSLIMSLLLMALLLPTEMGKHVWMITVSVTPIAIAGLAEDMGFHIRPKWRLAAAALSSVLAIAMLGVWLLRTSLPGLDTLMLWSPFAMAFTVFACAGLCNAFNLIDGLNGLAAGMGVIAALGLSAIAIKTGQAEMAGMQMMLIAGLLGFLVFNFPLGKIFLGDMGAYALGHILAWSAIILLHRVPDLSPWAVLLIFFWPVADTLFAIYRRRRAGRPTDMPDRLHFHQLVMRAIEITLTGRVRRQVANPLATLLMAPLFAAPVAVGVLLWNLPLAAFMAVCCFAALFVVTYGVGLRATRRYRRSRSASRSVSFSDKFAKASAIRSRQFEP